MICNAKFYPEMTSEFKCEIGDLVEIAGIIDELIVLEEVSYGCKSSSKNEV